MSDNHDLSTRDAQQSVNDAQQFDAVQASQRLLNTTLRSIGDAVIATDEEGRITFMNAVAEQLTGWTEAEARGVYCSEVFRITHQETGQTVESPVDRVLREGIVVGLANHTILTARGGTQYPIDDSGAPIRDPQGNLYGVVLVFRDVTEKKRTEIRQAFLQQAGDVLGSSLDYQQTLQAVTHLAVPRLADWCTVDMPAEDGTIRLLAAAHVNPEKLAWGRAFREEYPPDPNAQRGTANVLRTGQSERYPDILEEAHIRAARDGRHLQQIRQFGIVSVMIVPMIARGRVLGAISFVATTESGQRYTEEDQALAESLAARAALAVDNARLYQAAQQEIEQREKTEAELRRRQAEIETLNVRLRRAMAETHHRVKNNLQVVSALVELQAADAGETVPTVTLRRVGQHVKALATIHEILTEEARDEGEVEYLSTQQALTKLRPLLQSIVGARKIDFHIEDTRLPIRLGTSLAVLINELVSNAVKHGAGEIYLSLTIMGEQGCLEVRDRGPGFSADFNPQTAANTGLELILSLGRWDLRGELTFQNHPDGGAWVTVTFPLTTS